MLKSRACVDPTTPHEPLALGPSMFCIEPIPFVDDRPVPDPEETANEAEERRTEVDGFAEAPNIAEGLAEPEPFKFDLFDDVLSQMTYIL